VSDWQKKHAIADDDPLFAAVELFEIYAKSLDVKPEREAVDPPSFSEFRDTLQSLDQISKRFTNVAQDLTTEMRRKNPGKSSRGNGFFITALVTVFLGACGYIYWEFYL